jgi:hypothetical protein
MFDRFTPSDMRAQIRPRRWFSKPAEARIVDMSDSLIGLCTMTPFQWGQRVRVLLTNGAPGRRFDLPGIVRYTEAAGSGQRRIEVEFVDLDLETRRRLRALRPD